MTNMIMFQQAYNASARMMTAIDEILDNKDLYNTYHNNLLKLSISNSSTIIYESIKKLINEEK